METIRTIINIEGVSKYFDHDNQREYALKNVSLSIRSGEVLMLMGPSGSGKTTLLSIMGCILKPSAGSVTIAGQDTARLSNKELGRIRLNHIGFIFQEYNLFKTLNVVDNIIVALDLRGIKGKAAYDRAMLALETVDLAEKAKVKPETLSGGQKQRLAIARALAGQPSVILADEPTAALDSKNGKNVVQLMSSLAHEHDHSVVIVTHDPRTLNYADRILTIEDGTIQSSAETNGTIGSR